MMRMRNERLHDIPRESPGLPILKASRLGVVFVRCVMALLVVDRAQILLSGAAPRNRLTQHPSGSVS